MVHRMRTRISTTVDEKSLSAARKQTGLPDSQLLDRALSALLERAEHEAEDRALSESPYDLDAELAGLPTGWPSKAPSLDAYDGAIPADVVAYFAERNRS